MWKFSLVFAYFVVSVLLSASPAQASLYGDFPRTRLSLHQNLYSGEKGKSFAEASTGVGAGVSVFLDGKYLIPFFGFKFNSMAGRQMFLDDRTEVSTTFTYYSAAADIGLHIFPIERRSQGLNVYLIGLGTVGYNLVALAKGTTLASIPHSDQSFSAGYGAGIGAEWILSNTSMSKWTIGAEVALKQESATLFKRRYDLSHLQISFGMGW